MRLLVSACLLGINCRYNGRCITTPAAVALGVQHTLIPVCPEQLGGLPTPREPAECRDGRVYTVSGLDVTEQYRRGAEETLRLAQLCRCVGAVFQERSPSCGFGRIHDGGFAGGMVDGSGMTAALLRCSGFPVIGAEHLESPDALAAFWAAAEALDRSSAVSGPTAATPDAAHAAATIFHATQRCP